MKLRVGILSPFYKNYNYGGKLQAYALVRAVEQAGCEARQILYAQPSQKAAHPVSDRIFKVVQSSDYRSAIRQKFLGKCLMNVAGEIRQREKAIDAFDAAVPHTEQVFSDATIARTCECFDAFICGSDQIWNPMLFKKAYYLEFVPKEMYRFSYAASIANTLGDDMRADFCRRLSGFDEISVRERNSQTELQELLGRNITLVVDPTLLLERADWDSFAGEPVITDQPYLLCYFLGYGGTPRRAAEQIARIYHLQIVTFPHMLGSSGRFYWHDLSFGDSRLYDVSPQGFASLIKNAALVFTDSFHATVLSIIYQRQFLTFERIGLSGMNTRIQDLLALYELQSRGCPINASGKRVQEIVEERIIYKGHYPRFETLRKTSWAYLKENLQNAEDRMNENQSD